MTIPYDDDFLSPLYFNHKVPLTKKKLSCYKRDVAKIAAAQTHDGSAFRHSSGHSEDERDAQG